jgi:16S rRNA U1498 N3-methylase RsmE
MSTTTYLDQTTAMMRELEHLRSVNRAQAGQIAQLTKQYDDLAADHAAALEEHQRKMHNAYTDRDVAERKLKEIEGILDVTATHILQAMRARKGDTLGHGEQVKPQADAGITYLSKPNKQVLDDALNSGRYLR